MTGATDTTSRQLMARARELFPGGVNSPVRAFGGVGGDPFVAERGEGCRIWDVDGKEYIDFVLSWGPLVLGHSPPVVLGALEETMRRGTSFGVPTELEIRLAELIVERMPHIEMLRFVSSGTEATMSAIRVARAVTRRDFIIKFDGCYHGHGDSFLVKAGSGVATLGLPNSPGVPEALAALTITAPFNDLAAVERALAAHEVAAVIVEPIVGNAGFIVPDPDFLPGLRALTEQFGALLVFDEVMTGFRALWCCAGPHNVRQGDRWRPSGRRVWRTPRDDGVRGAEWTGVSSWNTLRKSAGDGRGNRDARDADAGAPRPDRDTDDSTRPWARRERGTPWCAIHS
jgi:glutamate-1-semialdehyde 2,1-aminomutase